MAKVRRELYGIGEAMAGLRPRWRLAKYEIRIMGVTDSKICRGCLDEPETPTHVMLYCTEVAKHRANILGSWRTLQESLKSPRTQLVLGFWKELGWLEKLAPSPSRTLVGLQWTKCGKQLATREEDPILWMVYTRPPSMPVPTVWHRFLARGSKLRVQDMTEEQVEPAVQLLLKYFTADEPPCKYIEIKKHPGALAELEKLWRTTIQDNVSVVCVEDRDGPEEIIGVNVLTVCSKNDKEEEFKTEDKIWAKLFGAVDLVGRSVDIFERYGVDQYLTAYGLVIAPEWRGCGIGKEILLARIPLCKALGVKVTATVFTAGASQAAAKRAGFQDLYQISYEELAEQGFRFPGVEENTKYSKLMALEIV